MPKRRKFSNPPRERLLYYLGRMDAEDLPIGTAREIGDTIYFDHKNTIHLLRELDRQSGPVTYPYPLPEGVEIEALEERRTKLRAEIKDIFYNHTPLRAYYIRLGKEKSEKIELLNRAAASPEDMDGMGG